jgi:hypothetical protein
MFALRLRNGKLRVSDAVPLTHRPTCEEPKGRSLGWIHTLDKRDPHHALQQDSLEESLGW